MKIVWLPVSGSTSGV